MEDTNEKEAVLVGEHVEVRPGRVLHIWQHKNEDDEQRERPVMLFVHGAGGRKEQWQAQIDHFKETHDVLAFDMVGHGQSNAVGDWYGYATAHLLQDLLAIVQRFVDPKREDNVLVAHSYGTVIAVKLLAHLHRHHVEESTGSGEDERAAAGARNACAYFRKVVLVGAAGDQPAGTTHPIWYLPSFALEWIRPVMGKGFVDKAWHPATDRELVLREANIAATNPMHVMRPLFRGMEWQLEDDASLIVGARFLFISGINDGITPHQSATRLAEWLQDMNSVLVEVLDQSGHMPHMEVPRTVNALIQDLVVHHEL